MSFQIRKQCSNGLTVGSILCLLLVSILTPTFSWVSGRPLCRCFVRPVQNLHKVGSTAGLVPGAEFALGQVDYGVGASSALCRTCTRSGRSPQTNHRLLLVSLMTQHLGAWQIDHRVDRSSARAIFLSSSLSAGLVLCYGDFKFVWELFWFFILIKLHNTFFAMAQFHVVVDKITVHRWIDHQGWSNVYCSHAA